VRKDILDLQDVDSLTATWYRLMEEYSSCSLTDSSDRLPDLPAIARLLAPKLDAVYHAGLRSHNMTGGLLWSVLRHRLGLDKKPARHPGPSWSWASCDQPVIQIYSLPAFTTKGAHRALDSTSGSVLAPTAQILHVHTQSAGSDPYAEIVSEIIRLKAIVYRVRLTRDKTG
jgi:hypothetical protein